MNRTRMWNPTHGCSPVSRGCEHCWAKVMSKRLAGMGVAGYDSADSFKVVCCPEKLSEPLRIKTPCRVGVSFMGDLFHPKVPDAFIDKVFTAMLLCSHHTFFVLTKRPRRMADHCGRTGWWYDEVLRPVHNVILGVSIEDQATADERIPHLLRCPAAHRWVSVEPMLGPVDLNIEYGQGVGDLVVETYRCSDRHLDWVVAGSESGLGARSCDNDWLRSLRDQCKVAGVPFHVKQVLGDWPQDLWIPEMPNGIR